jgi:hypothetical protein
MKCRVKTARVTFFAGLGLLGVLAAERPVQAAGQAEPLLRPTPLVLKDGRIANVSIHEVPFARGRAEITTEAGVGLSALTQAVGTDCFLTAQVIGHIASDEIAEQDSLSAHRLARSRADAVQASLIGGGLPAKAIASVWDWQFMVREPRATLWIFQLTAGEDCDGRPLQEDLVAEASPSRARSAPSGSQAVVPALPPLEPAPEQHAAEPAPARETAAPKPEAPHQSIVSAMAPAEPAPGPGAAETRRSEPQRRSNAAAEATGRAAAPAQAETPQPPREPAMVPGGERAQTGMPKVTQPLPAAEPKTAAAAPTERTVAAVGRATAATPPRAPQPAGTDGKIETGSEGGLVITFATNSSYFPPGTSNRLRQLLAEADPTQRYHLSVQVAVSGSRKVVGAKSAQEAARYNRWLAERRLERLERWLHENGNPETLSIRPEYLADDESRRVVVRVVPAG